MIMNKKQISKMVKSMVYVVNIVVIITLIWLACTGCQTVKGSLGDLSWGAKVLADNIVVQEK